MEKYLAEQLVQSLDGIHAEMKRGNDLMEAASNKQPDLTGLVSRMEDSVDEISFPSEK